jgi:sugar lactone lactonase YvrE
MTFALAFVAFATGAHAATFTSTQSGPWNSNLTWGSNTNAIVPDTGPGNGDGQFANRPSDVAVDASGNIYAIDTLNNRIEKFNSNGQYLLQWGTLGTDDGEMDGPGDIAVDSGGNVWIADRHNNRIDKFTPTGTFLLTLGYGVTDGSSTPEICSSNCLVGVDVPLDESSYGGFHSHDIGTIAADASGHVYAGDYLHMQKFNTDGTFITGWPIDTPAVDLAVDTDGSTYLAQSGYNRIEKSDPSGTMQFVLGWGVSDGANHFEICTSSCQNGIAGNNDGQFNLTTGIAVDSNHNIYVGSNNGVNRLQKFDSNGNFLSVLSTPTNTSAGLGIDSHDFLYVGGDSQNSSSPHIYKYDSNLDPIPVNHCVLTDTCVAGTDYPGASDEATVASSSIVTIPSSVSFPLRSLIIGAGNTLVQGSGSTLSVSGNWNNSGTYTPAPDAQVVLSGTNQSLLGNTTFANLTESVSSADTLSFGSNSTIAVSGVLSLNGSAGNLLSL